MQHDESILRRIERLEQENRWLKRWGRVLLAGVLVLLICGAGIAVDQQFLLTDRNGKSRLVIAVHPDSVKNVYLSMANDQQRQRLRFGDDPDNGTYFFIEGREGKQRLIFGVDRNDRTYLRMYDPTGKQIAQLP